MDTNSSTGTKPEVNVGSVERIISAFAGGVMLYSALYGKSNKFSKLGIGGFMLYRAFTGHCPAYSAIGKKRIPDPVKNINIRTIITVNRPRNEVYSFWRRLEHLPLFMKHLKSVEDRGNGKSHWVAEIKGVPGSVSWDAEIVREEEGSAIAWNSLPGSTIENAGKVEFFDAGLNRTEIHAVITYRAPLGPVGETIARLFNSSFEKMIREDLANFRNYIETGEVEMADKSFIGQEGV